MTGCRETVKKSKVCPNFCYGFSNFKMIKIFIEVINFEKIHLFHVAAVDKSMRVSLKSCQKENWFWQKTWLLLSFFQSTYLRFGRLDNLHVLPYLFTLFYRNNFIRQAFLTFQPENREKIKQLKLSEDLLVFTNKRVTEKFLKEM